MKSNISRSDFLDKIFNIANYIITGLFALICIYPFYYIFLYSISNPKLASKGNIYLLPAGFSLENYLNLLAYKGIGNSVFISVSRTVIGTLLTIFFTSMFAYVLTKHEFFARKLIYRMTVITMYLNAGLIPWYITMKTLGLKNSFLMYIMPYIINAFYLVLIKTYMESIHPSLEESAIIDGAGYFTIFLRIVLPISKPILAAVSVYSAVGQWNQWYDNFMLVDSKNLQTLQITLMNIIRQAESIAIQMATSSSTSAATLASNVQLSPTSIRMTITMVVTIPIIIVYPTLQKYFVKGIMMGAVKG